MISAMTSSATERELEKGELKTGIPVRAAVRRSTWFVPMQKQPIVSSYEVQVSTVDSALGYRTTHFCRCLQNLFCKFRLTSNPNRMVVPDLLNKFLLAPRARVKVNLESLRLE